jgi:hypothetical protein
MPVVKIVELVGVSKKSFDDAVQEAAKRAAKTLRNVTGLKVVGQTAEIQDGRIKAYKADVKIAFTLE